jgi:tetratricopeptide (TPR) repeat protein
MDPDRQRRTMSDARELIDEGLRQERAGMLDKALQRYEHALAVTRNPALIAEALKHMAHTYRTRCDWERALGAARRSAAIAGEAKLTDLLAEALNAEAAVHQSRGDFDAAAPLLERILETAGDDRVRGIALQNLGTIAANRGDLDSAEHHFEQSHDLFQRSGYLSGEASTLNNRAAIALDRSDFTGAESLSDEAALIAKRAGDMELVALATLNHAEALAAQGRYAEAEDFASTALGYFSVTGDDLRRILCLRHMGDFARLQDNSAAARVLFERGLELARRIGAEHDAAQLEERLAALGGH